MSTYKQLTEELKLVRTVPHVNENRIVVNVDGKDYDITGFTLKQDDVLGHYVQILTKPLDV